MVQGSLRASANHSLTFAQLAGTENTRLCVEPAKKRLPGARNAGSRNDPAASAPKRRQSLTVRMVRVGAWPHTPDGGSSLPCWTLLRMAHVSFRDVGAEMGAEQALLRRVLQQKQIDGLTM